MTQSAKIVRIESLLMNFALLCSVSILGCSNSASLPPLVEDQAAPQIPGKFVWHNLITNDGEAARTFYGELLGWKFDVKKDGRYSVITHHGHNIGGILDASKDEKPPKTGRWLSAISVADLDESLAVLDKAGGKQVDAPINVSGVGRVVTIEDADGALLHLLASEHGDPPDGEPSRHTWLWHELLANHAERAVAFYEAAFGYQTEQLPDRPSGDYRVLVSAGAPRAGVIDNPFESTRSIWIPYLRVDDPAALAERASALGGTVVLAPNPSLRDGNLALILDPTGAPIALQKWSRNEEEGASL
jgi:predicted enzyme related to lactoylglutathione lyase